ncbi:hypothetical protein phiPLPE_57 [Iodobacter phage PhiPLPE]|uniref:Cyanophage baseplate Pam3 plug gp18 domain-containing protein n=1 Tax=Iodobacter phage PhiPLPE TaxID=551895 RepID=B5AX76_9CAUD|nr:virion structural protein [Iodobacter phage PhiPLPE]ACG60379.1 hypothetical protein phiPLPE_57 [Iodobacter phage PhiPLPE]
MQEVPLQGGAVNAHQFFTLQLGRNLLDFTINYLTTLDAPAWSMDISRAKVPLVRGAMLEPGSDVIDLYNAGIGKLVFVGDDVTLDNLGSDNHLVWVE